LKPREIQAERFTLEILSEDATMDLKLDATSINLVAPLAESGLMPDGVGAFSREPTD
jgi:hypothetical protein